MQNKTYPRNVYIKEVDGKFEFIESEHSLTRKSEFLFKFRLYRTVDNLYQIWAKPHKHGKFDHIYSKLAWNTELTNEVKTFLLLYGFHIPTYEEYARGARLTLR